MSRAPSPTGIRPSGAPSASSASKTATMSPAAGVDLEAVGAGVAGARDQGRPPRDLAAREGPAGERRELRRGHAREHARRERTLEREQARLVAAVARAGLRRRVARDPAPILLDVRRVHADQQRVGREAVEGDVVDDAACLVAEQAVAHAADRERRDGPREQALGRLDRRRALELDLAHVRDVEEPRALAHGGVLLEDRAVLHRHLEAGELDHARAQATVGLVERRAQELAHAPQRAL